MELDFFIDGTLYDNPINWDEINASIEFDPVNQITTIAHVADMQWKGDVYNLLYQKYLDAELCDLLEIVIKSPTDNNATLFKGQISVPKCTFNERERVVTINILDDSFGARIENNKGAKVALDSTQSKNGEMVAATEWFAEPFDPSTGTYAGVSCRGYTVHSAFKFLIDWMTDNTVGFRSDFFDPSLTNDGAYDSVFSGIDLRNVGDKVSAPKFSFQELFDLMRRVRNIGMGFQVDAQGEPIVRIEEIDFFRSNTDTILLEDVNKTELSFEQNILYTTIKVGSDIIKPNDCSTTCNASNNVSYFGFETEYYTLTGECTNPTELTLTVDDPFIVDTNKIQETVEFNQDNYDDKAFLIHLNPSGATQMQQSDPLNIGEYWYNEAYTNKEILLRYQDYIVGTLGLYSLYANTFNLFSVNGNFNSMSPPYTPFQCPTIITDTPDFNTEIYDPQNRFNTTTDRFTPVDEGAYRFSVGVPINDAASTPISIIIDCTINLKQYDSGGGLIATHTVVTDTYVTGNVCKMIEGVSDWISMDAGDYLELEFEFCQTNNPGVPPGQALLTIGYVASSGCDRQYWICTDSRVAIQDTQVNGGEKRQLALTRFEYPIPFNTFQDLYADTTQRIRITSKGIDRTGYINSMNYNFVKGSAEVQIVSNG
jgi:hypothetical protein